MNIFNEKKKSLDEVALDLHQGLDPGPVGGAGARTSSDNFGGHKRAEKSMKQGFHTT